MGKPQQQQRQHTKRRSSSGGGGGGGGGSSKKTGGDTSTGTGTGGANTMVASATILSNKRGGERDRRLQEISMLQQRIQEETPPRGHLASGSTAAAGSSAVTVIAFRSLPISQATLRGLESSAYTTMTEIQAASLPHSLAGRDILGAARTGSGKTLAFCIPVLECLYRNGGGGGGGGGICNGGEIGPSAIILSPTRELAVQISQVFAQVGRFHAGSIHMACLIGGSGGSSKSKHEAFVKEQQHIASTNIIIATPGRLLQHFQETSQLVDVSQPGQIKILVLDEADRILDCGFRDQLMQILEYLPDPNDINDNVNENENYTTTVIRRQTLLFSATQTRHVKDLATLSLHRPEYIRVHDNNLKRSTTSSRKNKNDENDIGNTENTDNNNNNNDDDDDDAIMTPERLQQSYIVVPLKDKLNAIYSFIKSHLHCKSIIFLASCSQVRHAHLLFCALRPGVTILCLHGKLLQSKRTEIYQQFQRNSQKQQRHHAGGGGGSGSAAGSGVVLFSTDVCARGLDFPNVDWVVQMDAPEDRDMYIHRAGRTARYKSHGKALLMITPQEEKNGFVTNILQQSQSPSFSSSTSSSSSSSNNNKNKKKQLPLKKLAINPTKTMLVTQRAAALVASNIKLHQLAKKAFSSYLKSVMLMPHKQVFKLEDYQVPIQRRGGPSDTNKNNMTATATAKTTSATTDLDDFALSLGLAATPRLDFITKYNNKASMSRDECRSAKNVNRKLQKLKEQIKAEKLAKKKQKQGQEDDDNTDSKNKTAAYDNDNGSDDDELLVSKSKQRHDNMDESDDDDDDSTDLPDPGLDQVTSSRKAKRIRIDARGSGENKRIVFDDNDEGTLQLAKESLKDFVSGHTTNSNNGDNDDEETLQRATEEYMQTVRDRLQSNQKVDREQERDRIRQKHRKRRLQNRGGGEWDDDDDDDDNNNIIAGGSSSGGGGTVVTLLSSKDYAAVAAGHKKNNKNNNNDDESSTSSNASSGDESSTTSSSSSSSSSSSDDDDNEDKVKAQEKLALALIRGKK